MKITMYLVFTLLPFNVASNYFFLSYLNLGYIGAAYHQVCVGVFLITIYMLLVFSISDRIKRFLPGPTMQAFHNWGEFLKLGKHKIKLIMNHNFIHLETNSNFYFLKKAFLVCLAFLLIGHLKYVLL